MRLSLDGLAGGLVEEPALDHDTAAEFDVHLRLDRPIAVADLNLLIEIRLVAGLDLEKALPHLGQAGQAEAAVAARDGVNRIAPVRLAAGVHRPGGAEDLHARDGLAGRAV